MRTGGHLPGQAVHSLGQRLLAPGVGEAWAGPPTRTSPLASLAARDSRPSRAEGMDWLFRGRLTAQRSRQGRGGGGVTEGSGSRDGSRRAGQRAAAATLSSRRRHWGDGGAGTGLAGECGWAQASQGPGGWPRGGRDGGLGCELAPRGASGSGGAGSREGETWKRRE